MDHLAAIRAFSQVVESGSFAKAADRLGISTTAASRQVAELEAHLQTRLLNRTTRKVSIHITNWGRVPSKKRLFFSTVSLANCNFASPRACDNATSPRGMLFISKAILILAKHKGTDAARSEEADQGSK